MNIQNIRLLLFDVDKTIAELYQPQLYPEAAEFFRLLAQRDDRPHVALVTNQGGPAMRYWMLRDGFGAPEKYPTVAQVQERLDGLIAQIPMPTGLYVAYAHQSNKGIWSPVPPEAAGDPSWSRAWRKPQPGMILSAMAEYGMEATAVLMVGDKASDQEAAAAAGVAYCDAAQFWATVAPQLLGLVV
jgi:HAD superfamily hydrolase (TIGR01662 family)